MCPAGWLAGWVWLVYSVRLEYYPTKSSYVMIGPFWHRWCFIWSFGLEVEFQVLFISRPTFLGLQFDLKNVLYAENNIFLDPMSSFEIYILRHIAHILPVNFFFCASFCQVNWRPENPCPTYKPYQRVRESRIVDAIIKNVWLWNRRIWVTTIEFNCLLWNTLQCS